MDDPITKKLGAHLKGLPPGQVESVTGKLMKLPPGRLMLILDLGVGLAGSSLRIAVEFLRTAPDVSPYLSVEELKLWSEIGKRLAGVSPEGAAMFFQASLEVIRSLPPPLRLPVLMVCDRQSMISSSIVAECFRSSPHVIAAIDNDVIATRVYMVAGEIAKRSATQSVEFLMHAPAVLSALQRHARSSGGFDSAALSSVMQETSPRRSADVTRLIDAILDVASLFAQRAGGLATEFLSVFPVLLPSVRPADAFRLLEHTRQFLQRGGGVALHYFRVAARVLTIAGSRACDTWTALAHVIAAHDNAAVYNFLKVTPAVVTALAQLGGRQADEFVGRVIGVVHAVCQRNVFLGIECFKSSPQALTTATLDQFEAWARAGMDAHRGDSRRAHAYYALETRASQQALLQSGKGLALERVGPTLKLYIEGLTGRHIVIKPLSHIPDEMTIHDGKTIYLPAAVAEFGEEAADFRLYKVLAAFGAGHIEFGTYASDSPDLRELSHDLRAAFGSASAVGEESVAPHAGGDEEENHLTFSSLLALFPDRELAERIFTTLENARIDYMLRTTYRGLRRDLDFVQSHLREKRPPITDYPPEAVFQEILLRAALLGGVDDAARARYPHLVRLVETILREMIRRKEATVSDSLRATYRLYSVLSPTAAICPEQQTTSSNSATEGEGEFRPTESRSDEGEGETETSASWNERWQTRSDLFTFWVKSPTSPLVEADHCGEVGEDGNIGQQDIEPGDRVYYYDEWDHELLDFRAAWCRVIEKPARRGGRQFVEQVRAQYAPLISSIRHQFQLLRPEALVKIKGEVDGEDFDLQAVIDYALDRRTSGRVSDRLYSRRLRRCRDVSVSFLLDMSSSTARTVSPRVARPGAPPRPGKRIIDIEKEGLVLMSEALEAVGDSYSIQGFTSEGRHNVKFYVIKDFDHTYSPEVEARIGGITYQNNTRLGAAIRHTTERLLRQDARTRLLIVLSDGRPYDHDYGDSRYAREDTKVALRQARMAGVIPFCITIDRESEPHLRDMYGEVGYTIIDDVLSLPERLPAIYRRLTR